MSKCEHCHRTLTDANSVAVGYGPVCYKKLFGISLIKTKDNIKTSLYSTKKQKEMSETLENLDEVFKNV